MGDYKIRKVKIEDSKSIWQIRNHPASREKSDNPEEISFEKHQVWFENKYFKDNNHDCFILEHNLKVIGYNRFDFDEANDCYAISIAIDSNFYNRDLGHLLLSQSLSEFNRTKDIIAKVQKKNIASVKLFRKNDFTVLKEDEENIYFKHGDEPVCFFKACISQALCI